MQLESVQLTDRVEPVPWLAEREAELLVVCDGTRKVIDEKLGSEGSHPRLRLHTVNLLQSSIHSASCATDWLTPLAIVNPRAGLPCTDSSLHSRCLPRSRSRSPHLTRNRGCSSSPRRQDFATARSPTASPPYGSSDRRMDSRSTRPRMPAPLPRRTWRDTARSSSSVRRVTSLTQRNRTTSSGTSRRAADTSACTPLPTPSMTGRGTAGWPARTSTAI